MILIPQVRDQTNGQESEFAANGRHCSTGVAAQPRYDEAPSTNRTVNRSVDIDRWLCYDDETLPSGVTVTQQTLDLLFQVRILARQPARQHDSGATVRPLSPQPQERSRA